MGRVGQIIFILIIDKKKCRLHNLYVCSRPNALIESINAYMDFIYYVFNF